MKRQNLAARECVYLSLAVTIAPMKQTRQLILSLFLAMLSLTLSGVAGAAQETRLYQAQVPVADQGEAERARAIRSGLGQVLVKVTGNSQVLSNPAISQSLSRAENLITEYGYVSYNQPEVASEPGLALTIQYSQAAVDRLVRSQHLQIWPSDRPELLVWMVVDTLEQGRQFVSVDEQPVLLSILSNAMKVRAAPLMVPLLDLADRSQLTEEDVWNFSAGQLADVARRYNSDTWMAVRLYQGSNGQWRGARLLKTPDGEDLSSVVADTAQLLISQLVDEAVDRIATQYAFIPQSNAQQLTLNIEQVTNFQSFSDVTAYLESLELVRKVIVDYVEGDRLGLRLDVEGDISLLLDTLRRDSRLSEQPTTDFPGAGPSAYLFRWSGR
ncbi:MAG: DUF2066 domain-containing protein [Gammaproteobacteria bacterium]|nr:MAG: DUF2066 domain-containing protein [Gammaproteobacteria bacterium]